MWIGLVTLFPETFAPDALSGVFGRAVRAGHLTIECANPRDFVADKHRTIDDKPYGGGAGMVMQAAPLAAAVADLKERGPSGLPVVMLSPAGRVFKQAKAQALSESSGAIFICGRYEGVDQRFLDSVVDELWSVGDFVLSGGEMAALIIMDAAARHIPGVLGNFQSNLDESHLDGTLEYPQYTRPEKALNEAVPKVLLSGDHRAIHRHNRKAALSLTYRLRPDMLSNKVYSDTDRALLAEHFAETENERPQSSD